MPIYLNTRVEQISEDDLIKIFGLFCESYNIEINNTERDAAIKYLKRYGIEDLRGPSGLEFIFYHDEARFLGHRKGSLTKFYGYINNLKDEAKDKKFRDLVSQQFIIA